MKRGHQGRVGHSHLTWRNGRGLVPKVPMTEDVAGHFAHAVSMAKGQPYQSYRCPVCSEWHIGRRAEPRRPPEFLSHVPGTLRYGEPDVFMEMGHRAGSCLKKENRGYPKDRRQAIVERGVAAERRRRLVYRSP